MLYGAIFSEQAGQVFGQMQQFISQNFGFGLVILMNLALAFCVYLALSRYGDIRLGHQTEVPAYSFGSWIGMLFSAGIGIGLLYWGTAEPLYHFAAPPRAEPETVNAAVEAMQISFFALGGYMRGQCMRWLHYLWHIFTIAEDCRCLCVRYYFH